MGIDVQHYRGVLQELHHHVTARQVSHTLTSLTVNFDHMGGMTLLHHISTQPAWKVAGVDILPNIPKVSAACFVPTSTATQLIDRWKSMLRQCFVPHQASPNNTLIPTHVDM